MRRLQFSTLERRLSVLGQKMGPLCFNTTKFEGNGDNTKQ